jgi:YaiO family outer membrane protein
MRLQYRLLPVGCLVSLLSLLLLSPLSASSQTSLSDTRFSEVGLRLNREKLTGGRSPWHEDTVEWLHQFERRKVVIGRMVHNRRFGLADTTAGLSGYFPLGTATTGFIDYAASSTHRVLPRDSVHVQLSRALANGWGLAGGLKHVRYDNARVDIADLTVERYFSSYRAAFTLLPSRSNVAGSATSYRLQLGYYYGERNNVQFVVGDGTEVDRPSAIGQVLATSVRSLGLYGRHWLSPAWAFEYGAGHTVQGGFTRRSMDAGVRYRF